MAFEEVKQSTEDIQKQARAYIESNVAYYKLLGFKVAMKSTTTILKFVFIFFIFLFFILFISIAGAFAIADLLDSYALGFLIIGGVYLLMVLVLFLFKATIIERPVLEKFSEIFFND